MKKLASSSFKTEVAPAECCSPSHNLSHFFVLSSYSKGLAMNQPPAQGRPSFQRHAGHNNTARAAAAPLHAPASSPPPPPPPTPPTHPHHPQHSPCYSPRLSPPFVIRRQRVSSNLVYPQKHRGSHSMPRLRNGSDGNTGMPPPLPPSPPPLPPIPYPHPVLTPAPIPCPPPWLSPFLPSFSSVTWLHVLSLPVPIGAAYLLRSVLVLSSTRRAAAPVHCVWERMGAPCGTHH